MENQGTIVLLKNPVNRQRCKHVGIKCHFVRPSLEYCPTDQMVADVMTKLPTKIKLIIFVDKSFKDPHDTRSTTL